MIIAPYNWGLPVALTLYDPAVTTLPPMPAGERTKTMPKNVVPAPKVRSPCTTSVTGLLGVPTCPFGKSHVAPFVVHKNPFEFALRVPQPLMGAPNVLLSQSVAASTLGLLVLASMTLFLSATRVLNMYSNGVLSYGGLVPRPGGMLSGDNGKNCVGGKIPAVPGPPSKSGPATVLVP